MQEPRPTSLSQNPTSGTRDIRTTPAKRTPRSNDIQSMIDSNEIDQTLRPISQDRIQGNITHSLTTTLHYNKNDEQRHYHIKQKLLYSKNLLLHHKNPTTVELPIKTTIERDNISNKGNARKYFRNQTKHTSIYGQDTFYKPTRTRRQLSTAAQIQTRLANANTADTTQPINQGTRTVYCCWGDHMTARAQAPIPARYRKGTNENGRAQHINAGADSGWHGIRNTSPSTFQTIHSCTHHTTALTAKEKTARS